MIKWVVLSMIMTLVFLVGCGGGSDERLERNGESPAGETGEEDKIGAAANFVAAPSLPPATSALASAALPTPIPAAFEIRGAAGFDSAAAEPSNSSVSMGIALPSIAGKLQTTQRKIISVASISLEVEVVETAIANMRVIAEGFGGFVEQLSSSGELERQRAHVTVRVPQAQFFPALERIEALGNVEGRNVGSEDVSEQFIDLEARLKSSLREEQSFLSLLERTESVSEILTVERELSRVRSEIERVQGQLNFLERRVELATISVSLFAPEERVGEPPFGALTIEVRDVTDSVAETKNFLQGLNGSLDRVTLSIDDVKESAEISLRVFAPDFQRTLAALERQGEVRSVELREGTGPTVAEMPEETDARINISFVKRADSTNTWLIVSIAATAGGIVLAIVLGLLFYLTYRTGRRRASQA